MAGALLRAADARIETRGAHARVEYPESVPWRRRWSRLPGAWSARDDARDTGAGSRRPAPAGRARGGRPGPGRGRPAPRRPHGLPRARRHQARARIVARRPRRGGRAAVRRSRPSPRSTRPWRCSGRLPTAARWWPAPSSPPWPVGCDRSSRPSGRRSTSCATCRGWPPRRAST